MRPPHPVPRGLCPPASLGWQLALADPVQWKKETAFPVVPPSSPESPVSPKHFIAAFNSSQVAPSGTDGRARHGSASGMLRQQAGTRSALRCAKCPLAWDPSSVPGLPLIRAACCQVSIRQPVIIQLVLARELRKINQRIISNRSESPTTVFGEAVSNHCP